VKTINGGEEKGKFSKTKPSSKIKSKNSSF
jgi:hypothetical protein